MAEVSAIEWTDATWNPWQGCTKVSDACKFCYMYRDKLRYGQDPTVVVRSSPGTFRLPLARFGARSTKGEPGTFRIPSGSTVFTCSWSDFFHESADPWRLEAWEIIRARADVQFLVLTKRPERIRDHLPPWWADPDRPCRNVSLGITVEHQEAAELRVPELMTIPEGGGPTFVSYEPALGPVDWTAVAWRAAAFSATRRGSRALPLVNAFTGEVSIRNGSRRPELVAGSKLRPIGWLIAGGESGSKARPSNPDWFRMARDQAAVAGVPFLFKQWGEWVPPVVGGWWSPRWEPDARTGTVRVGKARAGRLLDDVDHNARPMFPAFHGVLPAAPL